MGSTTDRSSVINRALYVFFATAAAILWFAAPLCADDSGSPTVSVRATPKANNQQPHVAAPRAGDKSDAANESATEQPHAAPEEADDTNAAPEESPQKTSSALPSIRSRSALAEKQSGKAANPTISSAPFAEAFDDDASHSDVKTDVATFNGVQPGKTTAEQLTEKWGEGKLSNGEGTEVVRSYKLETFPRIDVTLNGDLVKSVVIQLAKPQTTDAAAKQLQLTDVRPVNIPDETGEPLGQAYPERGVLLTYVQGGKRVSHVTLEQIDLDSFVLRAEMTLDTQCHRSLADLNYVLGQQPTHARALWLRAKLFSNLSRCDEAMESCDASIDADPNQPAVRLLRGKILGQLGKYDQGAQQTKDVLASVDLEPELKAKALCQLADLIADSPAHDYKLAIDQHQAAIKVADPLSIDKHSSVRRAAKMVLVDAHLGLATDIASGVFQQKQRVVPQWLDRANAYADDLVANDGADPSIRLHVARQALAACAAMQGKIDSAPWARKALQQRKPLITEADDSWRKRNLEWELGAALSDGLTSDEARGSVQHSLENSTLTATYLEDGAKGRRENPEDVFRLGWMYYRVGAIYAVRHGDHKTAVTWYEKALPLLDRPVPPTQSAQQGHYGEWLVSMGITYWETGRREEGLDLTDAGMQYVEEGVKQKLLEPKALSVPYNNLAAMHQAMGHTDQARNFAEMAGKFEKVAGKPTPSIQR